MFIQFAALILFAFFMKCYYTSVQDIFSTKTLFAFPLYNKRWYNIKWNRTILKITIFIANQLMCNTTQLITIFRLNIHIKTSNKYEFVGILKYIVLRYRNVKGVYRWISKKQYSFGGHYNKNLHCYLIVNDKKTAKM